MRNPVSGEGRERVWLRACIGGAAALATAGTAGAAIVPQHQARTVMGLATADDPLIPGITQDGGTFASAAAGNAFWSADYSAAEGLLLGQAGVQQSSVVDLDLIAGSARIILVAHGTPPGSAVRGSASNSMAVGFVVDLPTQVVFSGAVVGPGEIRLDGPTGNAIIVTPHGGPVSWSGVLASGAYTLNAHVEDAVESAGGPGVSAIDSWEFTLHVVPAPGVLAVGAFAWPLGRRRGQSSSQGWCTQPMRLGRSSTTA